MLYLRGDAEGGEMADYLAGFGAAGLTEVHSGVVPGAGHFAPEDNPAAVWRLIAEFATVSR